jgi:hypothetical protein
MAGECQMAACDRGAVVVCERCGAVFCARHARPAWEESVFLCVVCFAAEAVVTDPDAAAGGPRPRRGAGRPGPAEGGPGAGPGHVGGGSPRAELRAR